MASNQAHKSILIKPIRTNESKSVLILDIVRLSFSLTLFCFATIACGYAIYASISLMPQTIPNWAVYIIFISALLLLTVTEGLHVAAVQVAYDDPNEYIATYPRAAEIMKYQNKGRNFQHFLIGRQIIVVFCVFVLGRTTTFNSFFTSLPSWFENVLMYSGFLGVVFVVQVAQLTPQILSSNFPVQFLNLFGVKYVFYACIILEKTGICSTVWLFCWSIQNTKCFKSLAFKSNPFMSIYDESNRKFNEVMNCDDDIKKKINKYILRLRDELHLDDGNKQIVEEADDEKIPLILHSDINTRIPYHFPSKVECAQTFADAQLDIPHFLLDEKDPNYIPSHLILLQILQKKFKSKTEL